MNHGLVLEAQSLPLQHDSYGPMMAAFEADSFSVLERKAPGLWAEILKQGSPVKVIFSSIEPWQEVAKHIDAGPHYVRRHFPLTAPVWWWDEENGDLFLEQQKWSQPLPFWKLHSVSNPSEVTRITMIVDFPAEEA